MQGAQQSFLSKKQAGSTVFAGNDSIAGKVREKFP
jgi:hypothetical protein